VTGLVLTAVLLAFGVAALAGCALPAQPTSEAVVIRAEARSAQLQATASNVTPADSSFALRDNRGQPMACLRIVAVRPGLYLGVYQVGAGSAFQVDLAESANLRTWHEVRAIETNASQPDLVTAGAGFLLAAEATTDGTSHPGVHYVEVRYYASLSSLLRGKPSRTMALPHRVAPPGNGIEGTPVIETADMKGGLDHSVITVSFHYLNPELLDRQGIGVLKDFSSWSARADDPLDQALIRAGVDGKHGDRSFVPFTGDSLEMIEAERNRNSPWEVYLYNRASGTVALLNIRTPGGSRSFANPTIACVPDPAGQEVAVITLFVPNQQAGPGESGELLYDNSSPLCLR
jgi:hypothetical protein